MNMRDLMEAVVPLTEMPALVPQSQADDINVNHPEVNTLEYQRLIRSQYNPLVENDHYVIGNIVEEHEGELFLLDIVNKKVCYTAQYEIYKLDGLGKCCSTYMLWKSPDCPVKDITQKMFWGPMIQNYDTILSDKTHTQAGKAYWIARMSEAVQKGFSVGFITDDGDAQVFGGGNVQEWVKSLGTWGYEIEFEESRFFITKRKV